MTYVNPNAPTKAEVLGTWMLSVPSGHKRYSHVTTIRCDGVNPGLLGMRRVISEDALHRALAVMPGNEGVAWMDGHLSESMAPLLDAPWILDIDTTVKPLYGKQEGSVVSYNPHCGAVQLDDRLDFVLRPYQADHRPNRAVSNAPISRTSCEWNRVTAVFRLHEIDLA